MSYTQAIQILNYRVITSVAIPTAETNNFCIRKSLHRSLAMSFVMCRKKQKIISKCILFADDTILINELKEDVNF